MADRLLLRAGLAGGGLAALCCFTPLLAIALGALGASALLAWADYVVLPVMVLSIAAVGVAVDRRQKRGAAACRDVSAKTSSGSL